MPNLRVVICTVLALVAFAGNSLLCRAALAHTHIDAASFTTGRLLSGTVVLSCLVWLRRGARGPGQLAVGVRALRLCRRLFLLLSAPDRCGGGAAPLRRSADHHDRLWAMVRRALAAAADRRSDPRMRRTHRAAAARTIGAAADGRPPDARCGDRL